MCVKVEVEYNFWIPTPTTNISKQQFKKFKVFIVVLDAVLTYGYIFDC